MSSIYKKGRDGYYYYQTYIYNNTSKKKDKRIFHALGTKDLKEAEEKQYELDLKYDKMNKDDSDSLIKLPSLNLKRFIITIVLPLTALVSLIEIFVRDPKTQESKNFISDNRITPRTKISSSELKNEKDDIPMNETNNNHILIDSKKQETIVVMPDFIVERIDKLPNSFKQGKVYVTIDKNTNKESQRLLCSNLKKRYVEFSSIIICLYVNNNAGRNLARGIDENTSIEKQKKLWLAMYSYNPVEGEYFDDNPTRYLNAY